MVVVIVILFLEVFGSFDDFRIRISDQKTAPGVILDNIREYSVMEENNENAKNTREYYSNGNSNLRDITKIVQVSTS